MDKSQQNAQKSASKETTEHHEKVNSDQKRTLPPEALRALAEAEERRSMAQSIDDLQKPAEQGGPKGVEPTRYGDWERKGRAVDF